MIDCIPADLQEFEEAFRVPVGSCRDTCACGKEFYDDANDGYSWEEGELEKLRSDPKAVGLRYSVGYVEFEGRQFVLDCPCWHERARKIIGFINGHARPIATFLTLEKKRKQAIADASPTVD